MPRVAPTESKNLESPNKPSGTLAGSASTEDHRSNIRGHRHSPRGSRRLRYAIPLLFIGLIIAFCIGLYVGYQNLDFTLLRYDPVARNVFFRLRLPRVILAAIVGSSLASVGAALQSLFRNPLADPFTLGVSGGAALGAGIAIVLGLGVRVA